MLFLVMFAFMRNVTAAKQYSVFRSPLFLSHAFFLMLYCDSNLKCLYLYLQLAIPVIDINT